MRKRRRERKMSRGVDGESDSRGLVEVARPSEVYRDGTCASLDYTEGRGRPCVDIHLSDHVPRPPPRSTTAHARLSIPGRSSSHSSTAGTQPPCMIGTWRVCTCPIDPPSAWPSLAHLALSQASQASVAPFVSSPSGPAGPESQSILDDLPTYYF